MREGSYVGTLAAPCNIIDFGVKVLWVTSTKSKMNSLRTKGIHHKSTKKRKLSYENQSAMSATPKHERSARPNLLSPPAGRRETPGEDYRL